jgi:hypothetical protein
MSTYKIFIDESCHLQNDFSKSIMCIGYTKLLSDNYNKHKEAIHSIKLKHKTPMELKWEKVSKSRLDMYYELIEYFFNSDIDFRCILVKYKENLDHEQFNQGSHDNFYYKLIYFLLFNTYFNPANGNQYQVYLDIKDTRGKEKIEKIEQVFENYYRGDTPFNYFQHIRSEETPLMQLTDFLIGAVSYKARYLKDEIKQPSETKLKIIEKIEELSGYKLEESSEPWDTKFNIFDHQPKKRT